MKRIKSTKSLFAFAVIALLLNVSNPSQAQLSRLKNKIKGKTSKVLNKKESSSNGNTEYISGTKESLKDQGITNDVHQKYIGKIVWSSEKIDFKAPDESKFQNSFTTDDFIYGRFFLSESMQNTIYKATNKKHDNLVYYYDVYVDGEKQKWTLESEQIYGEYIERTTQQVWVYIPEKSDRVGWMKLVNSLSTGEHEFKIDLRAKTFGEEYFDMVFATGNFKFNKKEGAEVKIGLSYSTIEAGMKNTEVESKILACISGYARGMGWKEKFDKVKIKSNEWYTIRNKYSGIILGRSVTAYCFAKWPDGHCTVQQFSFKQQYDGNNYGKTIRFDGIISGTQKEIDCE